MSLPFDRMSIQGRAFTAAFGNMVVAADEDLTLEVAGQINLTVNDPNRLMLQPGGLLDQNSDGLLDADLRLAVPGPDKIVYYRLAKVAKSGDQFMLPFEDEAWALMRRHKRYLKATRKTSPTDKGGVTAAQFIHRMVREVKSPALVFRCPEEGTFQDVAAAETASASSGGKDVTARGFSSTTGLTVKGVKADKGQLSIGATLLRVAAEEKAGLRATLALLEAGIVEAELKNVQGDGADSISFGVIQNIPGRSVGIKGTFTKEQALDVEYSARSALLPPGPTSKGGLIKIAKENPGWSPGQVAARAINGGGDPDYAAKCDGRRGEVEKWLKAFGSEAGAGFTEQRAGSAVTSDYEFTRGEPGKPESTVTAGKRIADERGWRFTAVENVVYYVSETRLFQSKAATTLAEYQPGVDGIDWEWAPRRELNTLTATVRMEHGALLPGMVADVVEQGPASGRWLITQVKHPGDSEVATLTLAQPQKPHKEPAASSTASTGSTTDTGSAASGTGGAADRVYAKARAISDRNLPYGPGGHGQTWAQAESAKSYDCSSYTSMCLKAGGLMPASVSGPQVSDYFLNWGKPGEGDELTVWVKAGSGDQGHVWIEFKGRNANRADTSPQGSGGNGPHLRFSERSKAGFVARRPA